MKHLKLQNNAVEARQKKNVCLIIKSFIKMKKAVNSKQRNEHDHEHKKLMILIENNKRAFYKKNYIKYT